jgi:ribosomal protein S18 acetylase RimI-like enzyme
MAKINESDFKACSELFEEAFSKDPLFNYLFGRKPKGRINKFFRFILEYANVKNQVILGEKRDGVIQGAACMETPQSQKPVKSFSTYLKSIKLILQFAFQIKWPAFKKINHYMKITSERRPGKPHHYLVCIGVNPKEQGKGIGRSLLESIHEEVDKDTISIGIGLDTENKNNVELYKKFGYQLVSEDRIGDITIYSMFRSKN